MDESQFLVPRCTLAANINFTSSSRSASTLDADMAERGEAGVWEVGMSEAWTGGGQEYSE